MHPCSKAQAGRNEAADVAPRDTITLSQCLQRQRAAGDQLVKPPRPRAIAYPGRLPNHIRTVGEPTTGDPLVRAAGDRAAVGYPPALS